MNGKLWGKTPAELAAICKPAHNDMPALAFDDDQPMRGRAWVVAGLSLVPWAIVLALGYVIGKFW